MAIKRCLRPLNPVLLMRQKGSGPFFQDVGGACAKSVGNFVAPGMPGEDFFVQSAFERWYEAEMSLGAEATFTRSSAATVMMADGNVRDVLSGEARFVNCRRVENFVDNSVAPSPLNGCILEDFTDGVARFSGPIGSYLSWGIINTGGTTAYPYTARVQVRVISGSDTGFIQLRLNGDASGHGAFVPVTSLQTWTTIGANVLPVTAFPGRRYVNIRIDGANDLVVEARYCQMEETTGQANTTPSEYVSLGMGDDHGANVDGVKYFNTTNGNTLVAGILTDLPGTRLTGDTGLLLEDTSTNRLINTDSFDLWNLTGATQSEDTANFGPTGYPVQSLTRTNGANLHRLFLSRTPAQMGSPLNGDRAVISGFIKVTNASQGVSFFLYAATGRVAQIYIYENQTVDMGTGDWFDYKVLPDGWVWVAVAGEFVDASLNHGLYVDDFAMDNDDGTVFAEVAGLQLEIMTDATRGTYASSYIPCDAASVVRDVEKLQHHMAEPTHTDFAVVIRHKNLAELLGMNRMFGTQDNRGINSTELRGNYRQTAWLMDVDADGGCLCYENNGASNSSPEFNVYIYSGNQIDPSNVQKRILFNDVKVYDENEAAVLDHSNLDIIETLSWEYPTEHQYHYPAICKYIAMYNVVMTDNELIQASETASLLAPPLIPTQHGS